MRIKYMTTNKQNILADLIQQVTNTELLNKIETLLSSTQISTAIDNMFTARGWPSTDQYGYSAFKQQFENMIVNASTTLQSKMDYVKLLSDHGNLILNKELLNDGWAGHIDDLVTDEVAANDTFRELCVPLFQLVVKSKDGKGEYWTLLHGVNSKLVPPKDHMGGDVEVDGVRIELKDATTGGSIHAGKVASQGISDVLYDELLTKISTVPQFAAEVDVIRGQHAYDVQQKQINKNYRKEKRIHNSISFFTDEHIVVRYLKSLPLDQKIDQLTDYIERLYGRNQLTDQLISDIITNLGTDAAKKILVDYVYTMYASNEKFHSMLMFSLKDDKIAVANVSSSSTLSETENTRFNVSLARGGNTQATPDGYVSVTFHIPATNRRNGIVRTRTTSSLVGTRFEGHTKVFAARVIFDELCADGNTPSRGEVINALVEQINMSTAGASTYYFKLQHNQI